MRARATLAGFLQVVAGFMFAFGALLVAIDAGSDDIGTLPYAIPWTGLAVVMLICAIKGGQPGSDAPRWLAAATAIGAAYVVGLLLLSSAAVI